jgi:hypothetical protein
VRTGPSPIQVCRAYGPDRLPLCPTRTRHSQLLLRPSLALKLSHRSCSGRVLGDSDWDILSVHVRLVSGINDHFLIIDPHVPHGEGPPPAHCELVSQRSRRALAVAPTCAAWHRPSAGFGCGGGRAPLAANATASGGTNIVPAAHTLCRPERASRRTSVPPGAGAVASGGRRVSGAGWQRSRRAGGAPPGAGSPPAASGNAEASHELRAQCVSRRRRNAP